MDQMSGQNTKKWSDIQKINASSDLKQFGEKTLCKSSVQDKQGNTISTHKQTTGAINR